MSCGVAPAVTDASVTESAAVKLHMSGLVIIYVRVMQITYWYCNKIKLSHSMGINAYISVGFHIMQNMMQKPLYTIIVLYMYVYKA